MEERRSARKSGRRGHSGEEKGEAQEKREDSGDPAGYTAGLGPDPAPLAGQSRSQPQQEAFTDTRFSTLSSASTSDSVTFSVLGGPVLLHLVTVGNKALGRNLAFS